jgi:hypothetical protein
MLSYVTPFSENRPSTWNETRLVDGVREPGAGDEPDPSRVVRILAFFGRQRREVDAALDADLLGERGRRKDENDCRCE